MKLLVLLLVFQVTYCDWSLVKKFLRFFYLIKIIILQVPTKEINYLYKRTECKHYNPAFIDKFTCRNVFVNRSSVSSTIEFNFRPEVALDKVFVSHL